MKNKRKKNSKGKLRSVQASDYIEGRNCAPQAPRMYMHLFRVGCNIVYSVVGVKREVSLGNDAKDQSTDC